MIEIYSDDLKPHLKEPTLEQSVPSKYKATMDETDYDPVWRKKRQQNPEMTKSKPKKKRHNRSGDERNEKNKT